MSKEKREEESFVLNPQYGMFSAARILVFRSLAAALSILILWKSAENNETFFSTLTVFAIGQLLYAVSLKAMNAIRKLFSLLIIVGIAFMGFIALGGLFGAIRIIPTEVGHMIALVKPTSIIYLWESDAFVFWMGGLLIFAYVVEWGTSWFAPVRKKKTDSEEESE